MTNFETAYIGKETFKSGNHTYRLLLTENDHVYVQRQFNNEGTFALVPSGWSYKTSVHSKKVTIDGGTNWTIDIPTKAWKELESKRN